MAFTRDATLTLAVPGEKASITIRKLSHKQASQAADIKRRAAMALLSDMGDLASRLPKSTQTPEEIAEMADDPANVYDRDAVLYAGITAWSYDTPLSNDAIDDQDEAFAAWAFGEICKFSFRSAAEGEASGSVASPTTV